MSTLPAALTSTSTRNIDPTHSVVEFKVKHMMISNVKAQFAKITGTLTLDALDLARSAVEASIHAASIETHDSQRDAHLKNADFLHVEQCPHLTFKSTHLGLIRDGQLEIDRNLTIPGITRTVHFTAEGPTYQPKIHGETLVLQPPRAPGSTARTSA